MQTAASPARQPEGVFSSATRVAQALAVTLIVSYGVSWLSPGVVNYLALVPGSVVPHIWTLLSCSFLETNLAQLLFCVIGVLFSGKVLEPTWGSREFLKFVLLVAFMTGTLTFCVLMVIYVAQMANPTALYLHISGFHGVIGGLLVGIKQALPDREARIFSVVRIPGKYLPSIYVLAGAALGLVMREVYEVALFILFGTYFAWWYLRFFQGRSDGRGDGSPEFRFATFFPSFMHGYVDAFAAACSRLFRVFPDVRAPAAGQPLRPPLPSTGIDASRRRERGARVLEERLGMKPRQATTISVQEGAAASQSPSDLEAGGMQSGA